MWDEFKFNQGEHKTNIYSIGEGEFGGKASGLIEAERILCEKIDCSRYPSIEFEVPEFYVIKTDVFDQFLQKNNLFEAAYSDLSDSEISRAFLNANLPTFVLGDLRNLVKQNHFPLAVRSSSLLEDKKFEPFAGIYLTKMLSNNNPSVDYRFNKLSDAIKLVYASTFFKQAKNYIGATANKIEDEKMAVIIQKAVGKDHGGLFYPTLSGVMRSNNFYPCGKAKPEDGVISLALGLGKSIVDGGVSWNYSPKYPRSVPPFSNPNDLMKNTQLKYWAINLDNIDKYNPFSEVEFMVQGNLNTAELHKELSHTASTYIAASDKVVMGVGSDGPRIINFQPLLMLNEYKFNNFISDILSICTEEMNQPVEIEFAMNLYKENAKFGFLQIRPMVVSNEEIEIEESELRSSENILASKNVLGNGFVNDITDIVFVIPEKFDKTITQKIAGEIDLINKKFQAENRKYLLIGFGRWGSSDPWLGIPVDWGQISNARVIVESALCQMNVDMSQGSHFFHNLTSFQTFYFSLRLHEGFKIDWDWINQQKIITELNYTKHIKLDKPLNIKVDGKTGKGIIRKW